MAQLLSGKPVAESIKAQTKQAAEQLKKEGIFPTLAVVRLGEKPSDLSYEKGILRCADEVGVSVKQILLPETAEKEALLSTIDALNGDDKIHGVLLFRPLPKHLKPDADEIYNRLRPEKDVDGMTALSCAALYSGKRERSFAPCTPEACIKILDFYGIDCTGKNTVVIGRSVVVGKPAAMLLMERNATVTVCHRKTKDLPSICRRADIIVSAAGELGILTEELVAPGQIVIDVSVNWDENKPNSKGGMGAIAGDAVFEAVEPIVAAITPVPGGVGAVTTSVLLSHVAEAALQTITKAVTSE